MILYDLLDSCSDSVCQSQGQILSFPGYKKITDLGFTEAWVVNWSPDGTMLSSDIGEIWDAASGSVLAEKDYGLSAWSPDGNYLVSIMESLGGIYIWGIPPSQIP